MHVVALQQRARRRVAHAVDLLVDRGFLLDVGVGARHVGLGLVVVVVGDEILDRVVREEVLELAIELRGQRLVRREDQGRALRLLDHLGHGEGLARAGDAEQHLGALGRVDALDEIADGGRLVAGRLEVGLTMLDGDAAFGFLRPGRAVRHPDLAVLVQRIAALDQRRQRRDRGGDAAESPSVLGVLQVDVEAGDRVEAGRGAFPRRWPRRPSRCRARSSSGPTSARGFSWTAWAWPAFRPPSRSARPNPRSIPTAARRTGPVAALRQSPGAPAESAASR